jgi:hypothetical protein
VLLSGETLGLQFQIKNFVGLFDFELVAFQILELFVLKFCFVFEPLILGLYIALYF